MGELVKDHSLRLVSTEAGWTAQPLEKVTLACTGGADVSVSDGEGNEYFRSEAGRKISFLVGGSIGTHMAALRDGDGAILDSLHFEVDAVTDIKDSEGAIAELFNILNRTMRCYNPAGTGEVKWRGEKYKYFVPWILDHIHTAKGMQYFSPHARGLVDLLRQVQKEDGMIWSFAFPDPGPDYYDTAYGSDGYAHRDGGTLFARQPVENHCEYNFVNCIHLTWKSSGDDEWLKNNLDAAMRALDYTMNSKVRWSGKYGLLKRGYTIDSWDFQVHDQYAVHMDLAETQRIDPEKTKFGIFFGDNTGYAHACDQLAEMLNHAGRGEEAERYSKRADEIKQRLSEAAWNGRFYTHRVEEDPKVKRDLGVDEKSQIAMSNAYSINRNITHEQCTAIIKTYMDLYNNLPNGSPGEWYAIYPPFGRGFGKDSERWQYMNGGVHGHAAGELARGALKHGYEQYGADILLRVSELAKKSKGIVKFAYTGAYDVPPPPQVFTTLDISAEANMDICDKGTEGVPGWMGGDPGNDLRNIPVGCQTFKDVPYDIPDPDKNGRRAAIAVSAKGKFPAQIDVDVNMKAGCIYLLHTSGAIGASGVAGAVTFNYDDGSNNTMYIMRDKHITGWWFPKLRNDRAGIAWDGPNPRSNRVGVCWAAIDNPHPDKTISTLTFTAGLEGSVYSVLGVTLADRAPYKPADLASFGGPDNWAGGTCMLALMEGLAGVEDMEGSTSYQGLRLSPRWAAAGVNSISVTSRYAASKGYVSYKYRHAAEDRSIGLMLTGGGKKVVVRILLPQEARSVEAAYLDRNQVQVELEKVENSLYAVLQLSGNRPVDISIRYGI